MQYVNRMQELENKVTSVGHSVINYEKKRVLLRGLLDEFNVTAEVIRATKNRYRIPSACLSYKRSKGL